MLSLTDVVILGLVAMCFTSRAFPLWVFLVLMAAMN